MAPSRVQVSREERTMQEVTEWPTTIGDAPASSLWHSCSTVLQPLNLAE
jgi:hypothetical protein